MKKELGLWIDDKKAVIFILADEGAEIRRISSDSAINIRFSGGAQTKLSAGQGGMHLTGQQNNFYNEVLSSIRDAESILIFGPDEAKFELKKRLENTGLQEHIVGIETVFRMTDNEIVTKIRQRFLK